MRGFRHLHCLPTGGGHDDRSEWAQEDFCVQVNGKGPRVNALGQVDTDGGQKTEHHKWRGFFGTKKH